MPSSNVCWGIEIGAGAIKAVKLETDGQRVNLLDFVSIEHPKVLSTPGVDGNDVLRVSLGQFVAQYDLTGAAIAVSVPGHSSFARFAKLPPVDPKKIPDIVKFEAMQQIPFPLEEVEWDYQTFQSPDSPEVEVGIFAIKRDRINERLELLADVGITPDFITLSPLAVFNAMAYDLELTEKSPGTIIVDVGTTSTDLLVSEAGRVWIRTFGVGGHNFTDSLVNTFKIGYPKAEALKKEAEGSQHARQVFQAMRGVFTDLGQEIQRSVGYYSSLHKHAKLERLIGVGSTFQLPGLRKFLKQQIGIEVYRVEQYKRLNTDSLKDDDRAKKFSEMALLFNTAYGLALQGLGQAAIAANLMPVKIIRETMWKGKVKWFGLAAGLALAASGAMFIRPTKDYFDAEGNKQGTGIGSALQVVNENLADASAKGVDKAATPDYRAANMLALLENRQIYAFLVDDLGKLFKDADAKAANWRTSDGVEWKQPEGLPAFTLRSFRPTYMGPPGVGSDGTPVDPAIASVRRIQVDLEVTTVRPTEADANTFMVKTADDWLSKNRERAGVPYKILPSSAKNYWIRTQVVQPKEDLAAKPDGDGNLAGGGGGKSASEPEIPRFIVGGDNPPPSNDSPDVSGLAPLKKLLAQRVVPWPTFTMRITWVIEILPPEAPKTPAEGGS